MLISDWSSDVCSSDLKAMTALDQQRGRDEERLDFLVIFAPLAVRQARAHEVRHHEGKGLRPFAVHPIIAGHADGEFQGWVGQVSRSEESRVGQEGVRTCRYWWSR